MSEVVVPPLAPVAPKTPVSAKVIATTIAGFLAPAVLLIAQYLLTDDGQTYFSGWPPLAVISVTALLTSAVVFVSGYIKRDPIREAGAQTLPRRALVE